CDTVNKDINLTSDAVIQGFGELISQLELMNIYPISGSAGSIFTYADMGTSSYATAYANIQGNIQANAAFMQLDSFANLATRASAYENLKVDWDVVAFPLFDSPASPCGSFGYGVFSYTENPDAAAALCLSIYTKEGQKAINTGAGGAVPLLSSLAGDTFWHMTGEGYEDKNYGAFVANTSSYIPSQVKCEVPSAVASIITEGMLQLFKDFYQGGTSWQDSLAAIEEQADQKWSTLA
ncbi:MAG: hypothetical protein IJX24_04360, partial [Oscillospiraceae bacterium]|nr:hypothetical protein [Oscillospiraceae bacterium]